MSVNISNNIVITDINSCIQVAGERVFYSEFVAGFSKEMGSTTLNMLHAAVGISGEAGELLDAVKKHWAYGKELDRQNCIEELGDLEFYMTLARLVLGVSRQEVLQANADKLKARYATGNYSDEQAQARADKVAAVEKEVEVEVEGEHATAVERSFQNQLRSSLVEMSNTEVSRYYLTGEVPARFGSQNLPEGLRP